MFHEVQIINSSTIPKNFSHGRTQKKNRSIMHEDDILYVIYNGKKLGESKCTIKG